MVSTRNPETMTQPERRSEIATLLSRGLLRRVRQIRAEEKSSQPALDVSEESRLSVSERPAG
jgi:hypothetical protein